MKKIRGKARKAPSLFRNRNENLHHNILRPAAYPKHFFDPFCWRARRDAGTGFTRFAPRAFPKSRPSGDNPSRENGGTMRT